MNLWKLQKYKLAFMHCTGYFQCDWLGTICSKPRLGNFKKNFKSLKWIYENFKNTLAFMQCSVQVIFNVIDATKDCTFVWLNVLCKKLSQKKKEHFVGWAKKKGFDSITHASNRRNYKSSRGRNNSDP